MSVILSVSFFYLLRPIVSVILSIRFFYLFGLIIAPKQALVNLFGGEFISDYQAGTGPPLGFIEKYFYFSEGERIVSHYLLG